MNREIKFRGKRTDAGMWIVGSLIPNGKKKAFIAPFKEKFYLDEVRTETVGQFTGLTDKNGKEIYEGDIVSGLVYADFGFGKLGFVNSLVKWNADRCSFELEVEDVLRAYLKSLIIDRLTVIGNVFDNPELLKGGEA